MHCGLIFTPMQQMLFRRVRWKRFLLLPDTVVRPSLCPPVSSLPRCVSVSAGVFPPPVQLWRVGLFFGGSRGRGVVVMAAVVCVSWQFHSDFFCPNQYVN